MAKDIPEILKAANKERFRRKLLISSRLIAVALILAIVWIGYVQVEYAKEFNELKGKYGKDAFCYMCGLESGRSCSCTYWNDIMGPIPKDYFEVIANNNIATCENRNNQDNDINFTLE